MLACASLPSHRRCCRLAANDRAQLSALGTPVTARRNLPTTPCRRRHAAADAAPEDGRLSVDYDSDSAIAWETGSHAVTGALQKGDYTKFVQFFRQASPYIEGHRARTFVVVIPGNVACSRTLLASALSDIALLHGLGVQVVVVVGAEELIDRMLRARHKQPRFMAGFRITDPDAMKVAVEAAGEVQTQCEQALSRGPAIPMIRRHTKGDAEIHFEPAMNVVSGNFVAAKRRGVVDGTDFGLTGEVRFVMKEAVKKQLELGNVVLLSQLGYTAAGDVLNCCAFDIGLHTAVGLGADKLFCLHLEEVVALHLPAWLPVSDAQEMLLSRVQGLLNTDDMDDFMTTLVSANSIEEESITVLEQQQREQQQQAAGLSLPAVLARPRKEMLMDLHVWGATGFPATVSTCVIACCKGVKRAHLLDARLDGGLLLELYTRDGVGTMISADFYEGLRRARDSDVDGVQGLLEPLVQAGVLVKRSRGELEAMMSDFIVVERETKLMGCAMLLPLGTTEDGINVAELGAFCVDPAFRGSGRGDSMLDYVEQEARQQGIRRLVLLTTRTADWFEHRGFQFSGSAFRSRLLPEGRRTQVNAARNSQLYVKELEACDAAASKPGKRIGF